MHTGRALLLAALGWSSTLAAFAQSASPAAASLEDLRGQMQELRAVLDEVRGQLAASNAETAALRREVQSLRDRLPSADPAAATTAELTDQQRLLAAKVDDQYQTKVESASKYQVRLSGMALATGFSVRGGVDSLDVPETARPLSAGESPGSLGATVRQSMLGIEVFGPPGAVRASGEIKVDFFGGFPATPEGVTAGLLRLRTAHLTLDWKNTSLVAGQDALFFSPLSPTSLVATAYPALSGAGNLWTWTPQIYVERRFHLSDTSRLSLQGGVLDPLTGELPLTEYDRVATAGERSRAPAYAARLAWQSAARDRRAAFGIGSYYSRQDWTFGRTVNAWTVTSDWDFPLGKWFAFSGELYRGRAIGGLGGGATGSVIFDGQAGLPTVSPLAVESAGGWSQLKFQPSQRLQWNAAFGKDASLNARFEALPSANGLVRSNAAAFGNIIFQIRSNLLFSAEYRRLWTSRYGQPIAAADHIALGAGILF